MILTEILWWVNEIFNQSSDKHLDKNMLYPTLHFSMSINFLSCISFYVNIASLLCKCFYIHYAIWNVQWTVMFTVSSLEI